MIARGSWLPDLCRRYCLPDLPRRLESVILHLNKVRLQLVHSAPHYIRKTIVKVMEAALCSILTGEHQGWHWDSKERNIVFYDNGTGEVRSCRTHLGTAG